MSYKHVKPRNITVGEHYTTMFLPNCFLEFYKKGDYDSEEGAAIVLVDRVSDEILAEYVTDLRIPKYAEGIAGIMLHDEIMRLLENDTDIDKTIRSKILELSNTIQYVKEYQEDRKKFVEEYIEKYIEKNITSSP